MEKERGYREPLLTSYLLTSLAQFVRARNLGHVTPPDAAMELLTRIVRIPGFACISWDRLPGRQCPNNAVPRIVPDIAVEVLGDGNTPGERAVKRGDYFAAG